MSMNTSREINWPVVIGVGLMLSVVLVIRTPDISGENIGNWFFAKSFLADLSFINFPKSPLYQLYLTPFTWMPFPASIVIERGVSTFLTFLPVAALVCTVFDWRIGLMALVLAAPDVLQVVPAAQALGFALACLALFVRLRKPFARLNEVSLSYALLLLAYALRTPFILVILIVLAWDVFSIIRDKSWLSIKSELGLGRHWPFLAVVVILAVMALNPSPHRWNNYHLKDETWVTYRGQVAGTISMNASNHYRERVSDVGGLTFDTYFIHKKLFGDSETIFDMARANPGELARFVARNFRAMFTTAVSMTELGEFLYTFSTFGRKSFGQTAESMGVIDHRYISVLLAAVYGGLFLFMAARTIFDRERVLLSVFLLGFVAFAGVGAILAKGDTPRYMYTLYGVYMFMAVFYAELFVGRPREAPLGDQHPRVTSRIRPSVTGGAAALAALFLLTQGGWARDGGEYGWGGFFRNFEDAKIHTLEDFFYSGVKKNHFRTIDSEGARCKGLMAFTTPMPISVFSEFPEEKLYSPFEIPPFGKLGSSHYDGLLEDRINCVYLFHPSRPDAKESITNIRIRMENYIAPYVERLLAQGAQRIDFKVGQLIILDR